MFITKFIILVLRSIQASNFYNLFHYVPNDDLMHLYIKLLFTG